ncbi:MAG TPA: HepT-like ribonuclease domain-containing protein [Thermoanaerobaculia bacterium]|nr:HepT-like ribonuclease domain-containing protein [Thermoanaerobaculia bacterium]
MDHLQQLERKSRLWHIERAAHDIQTFIEGRRREDYESEQVLALAIERELIIIGEALQRALQVDPELAERISDTRRIVNLRNQLVHNYPNIETERIWDIIHDDLPLLLTEVRALLATE